MKYLTLDGYVILNKNGNTYFGRHASNILGIFIQNKINDFNEQKQILDFSVKNNKLKLSK